MSKVFKAVAAVAGVASLALAFVPGGQIVAFGLNAAKLGAIAGAVGAISGTLAQLTAKPPKARGQVAQITVGANQPMPYMIGRSYSGGAMIHDIGYGGVVSDVDNPYRAMTIVYSCAGPVEALVAIQTDFLTVGFSGTAATGYYSDFLWSDWLDGTSPASRALSAQFAGEPGWSTAHKLSGFFAAKYTLKFDKKGKVWQAGVPQFGVIADGVRAYDPRLDSTRPGGSGDQRISNEATWAFTKNPALHALTYAYGRYQNGKKIFGVDLGDAAVDIASAIAFANVCDANGWEVNGTIFEPDDKWNNLKLICDAGGGVPVPGARLRFDYNAPGVSIDTITIHDLADGDISIPVTQGYATRLNTVQGVYTSPAHRWEPQPTDKIVDTASLSTDGEEKAEQFGFKLVTAKNQAAQLAAYKMVNSREKGPIVIPVKARLLTYPVGTFLTAQLPTIGLVGQKVKIVGKRRTMEDGSGELTLITETDAKHAFALSATSGAPPASVLVPPERLDSLFESNNVANDPSVLTINEKTQAIQAEQARAGRKVQVRARMVALGLSVVALDAAEASWLTYRNSISPSWSDTSQHSTINRTTWNSLVVAYDGALDAGEVAISEEDAKRATWESINGLGKDALIAQAANAESNASAAIAQISQIVADNVLDRSEKPDVVLRHFALTAEQSGIDAQATIFGVTTERTAYNDAITALTSYLDGLLPAYYSFAVDTPIDRTTFNLKFTTAYTARQALLNKLAQIALERADLAVTNAAAAQTAANAAQTSANTANTAISNISSDSLLTPDEKPSITLDRDVILAESSGIEARATSYGITTEKTTYTNAVSTLISYLATLTTPVLWSNLSGNTTIVGTTFRSRFADVYTARQTLLNKIAEIAGQQAIWSNISGTGKPENNADVTLTSQVSTQAPADVTINASSTGAIISGQFNKVCTPIVTRGGVSVRTDNRATYTVTNVTGGLVGFVSMNNTTGSADKGRATVTNCTATGTYQHNIFWDNVLIASYLVKFTVVAASAPIGGGGAAGTGSKSGTFSVVGFTVSSTSFVSVSTVTNLTKAAGETIRCTLPNATYQVNSSNSVSRSIVAKWQYSVSGANSWTDVGAAVTGSLSSWFAQDFSGNEGSITVNQNVAPADASYDLRLMVAMNTSGNSVTFTLGQASVVIGA